MEININDYKKNRGLEILFYNKEVTRKTDNLRKFSFDKVIPLFNKEFHIQFELSVHNKM